jgi:hypothetical protein
MFFSEREKMREREKIEREEARHREHNNPQKIIVVL